MPSVLHPYFKPDYIEHVWGSEDDQAEEIAAGDSNAKNWQAEARRIVEQMVYTCNYTVTSIRLTCSN